MSGEDRKSPHEIVIVRRRGGGHDDGHHGGAWKIAFADFMTALMCFFLVMWLINSTDKKTVTQVATYFNPLRLNDRLPSRKGLDDPGPPEPPGERGQETSKKEKEKSKKEKSKSETGDAAKSAKGTAAGGDGGDRELFRDPYGVLERIATEQPDPNPSRQDPRSKAEPGLPQDLFDLLPARRKEQAAESAEPRVTVVEVKPAPQPQAGHANATEVRSAAGKSADTDKAAQAVAEAKAKAADQAKSGLESQIRAALQGLGISNAPNIEVIETESEVLISITDEFDFGMFAVAAARPNRELVMVMERIGRILATTEGSIVIRGHTDARQYKTADYDNWRLSMARAQVTHFMLVRGGLQEGRLRRLEGHADKSLKVAAEPLAARNRRIEILIGKRS